MRLKQKVWPRTNKREKINKTLITCRRTNGNIMNRDINGGIKGEPLGPTINQRKMDIVGDLGIGWRNSIQIYRVLRFTFISHVETKR